MNDMYDQIDIWDSPAVDELKKRFVCFTSEDTPVPAISELLLYYRRSLRYTQAALSELLQIPKRSIENWETGKSTPPPYVTRLIWFALAFHAFTSPSSD